MYIDEVALQVFQSAGSSPANCASNGVKYSVLHPFLFKINGNGFLHGGVGRQLFLNKLVDVNSPDVIAPEELVLW